MSTKSETIKIWLLLGGCAAALLAVFFLGGRVEKRAEAPPLDPSVVASKSGLPGRVDQTAGVFRVEIDRPALKVKIAGESIPALELATRATVTGSRDHALAIGDIALTEAEVPAALRSAIDHGFNVTALHNRFLGDEPRIMSLHFTQVGGQDEVARQLGGFLSPVVHGSYPSSRFKFKAIAAAPFDELTLPWKGERHGSFYRVSLGFHTELSHEELGRAAGVSSWAEFSGRKELAFVNGEIAIVEPELRETLKSLLDSGMQVVSVHEHLTEEKPKLSFVHFLGQGPVQALADGVRRAMDLHDTHTSR